MSTEKTEPSVLDQFVQENPHAAEKIVEPARPEWISGSMGWRFLAFFLDNFFLFCFSIMLRIMLPQNMGLSFGAGWVVQFLYAGFFYREYGATPAKYAFGLKVVDVRTAKNLSFWQGGLRDTVGKAISGITLVLGYLMAFFTKDQRALHDFIFHSRVVAAPKENQTAN